MTENVVKKNSEGYGYSYASLGDIANQGFGIPKMKTGTEGDREYVYWYDTTFKEWVRGAEIVIPEAKGMNKAQIYGSALTYARRYTVQLALSLVCDDDKVIEDIKEDGTKKEIKLASPKQVEMIKNLYQEHDKICAFYKVEKLEDLSMDMASALIKKAMEGKSANK